MKNDDPAELTSWYTLTHERFIQAVWYNKPRCAAHILRLHPEYVNHRDPVSKKHALHIAWQHPGGVLLGVLLAYGADVHVTLDDTRDFYHGFDILDMYDRDFETFDYDYNAQRNEPKACIASLIEHGARVKASHSRWTRNYWAARKWALQLRDKAALCLLSPRFRVHFTLPPDMARLLAHTVMQCDWRNWVADKSIF